MAATAPAYMNGTTTPSPAEDEKLYLQLLKLQDVVLAGAHPHFKLPPAALEQLQATLIVPEDANSAAYATNHVSSTAATVNGMSSSNGPTELDPIFLQKSDSLVRAEARLKRQRLERELQAQDAQRKHVRSDRDAAAEGPSRMDIDALLKAALERTRPISGLKAAKGGDAASTSSFDTNDYYSSQAPSDWSSDASSSKGSDKGAGAFTADFERLDGPSTSFAESSRSAQKRAIRASTASQFSQGHQHVYTDAPDDDYEPEDEDDEYTPPDAAAFDSSRGNAMATDVGQTTPLEDDNSDYEPGEITQDSVVHTPYQPPRHPAQPSPRFPVIRNHLTHLAAPQPNRVSPLATAKGPSIELELVNGRPEVVQKPKPQQRSYQPQSRVSTASPSGPGVAGSNKKRRNKKRKRDQQHEPSNRTKKQRNRHVANQSPPLPAEREPYIKDEPLSPPPFANAPLYEQPQYNPAPAQVSLVSPGYAQPMQYVQQPPPSGLRYEYAQPASPAVVRVASPAAYHPRQRDTQDLRRVASLHHAQKPASPVERQYSPAAPYRAASMTYGEQRSVQYAQQPEASRYAAQPAEPQFQYARAERARSPPRMQEYQDPYSRAQSPAVMAPPPPRRIIVDQYGNRFYAAEPIEAAPVSARASVAPVERRPEPQPMYERAPSRMSVAYAQPPAPAAQHEPPETDMLPPPRRQEQPVQYVDANGYPVGAYSTRPAEPVRYIQQPTSPVYQEMPRYEAMPPPPPPPPAASERTSPAYQTMPRYEQAPLTAERTSPAYQQMPRYEPMPPPPARHVREPTSPVYQQPQQVPRAYSVRPEEPPQPTSNYVRQGSVAPVQYARQDMAPPPPPARAMSVAPAAEYGQQPMYGYAPQPQAVRYVAVDQYGREIPPQHVRQMSVAR